MLATQIAFTIKTGSHFDPRAWRGRQMDRPQADGHGYEFYAQIPCWALCTCFSPAWHVLPAPRGPARSCSLYSVLREVCRMGFREVVVHEGYRVPGATRRNGGDAGDQNAANDSGCSCGFLEERATSSGQDAFGPDAASPHASCNLAPAQARHSLLCSRPLNERGSHGAACVLGAGPASARPGVAGSRAR